MSRPSRSSPESPLAGAISGRTRVVGIFGDPVEHSRSPAMHNAAFAALGLNWVYVPFHVRPAELEAAVRAIRALGLAGVNVTVPHKEAVRPLLDALSSRAEKVGAVNTIINRGGRLLGDNTDVIGFLRPLRSARIRLRGASAVVIGAGGAARSAVVALAGAGAARILLVNRTRARARRLVHDLADLAVDITPLPLGTLAEASRLSDARLVVNTTSIGLKGERFPALACRETPPDCLFYDIVYGRRTDFLERARRAGRQGIDGSEMLIEQGACSFALWTGRRPPLEPMRAALEA